VISGNIIFINLRIILPTVIIVAETAEEFIERKKQKEIGRLIKVKDISRKGHHFLKVVAATYMTETDNPEKVFEILRLEHQKSEGEKDQIAKYKFKDSYRFGYYIIGKIRNKKDKWTWGQYAPMIPTMDLLPLIEKAKEEGTIKE